MCTQTLNPGGPDSSGESNSRAGAREGEEVMSQRIAVTLPLPEAAKELLRKSKAAVSYIHGPKGERPTLKELIERVQEADVLLVPAGLSVPKQVVTANPDLLGIANIGVGYNNIDVASANKLGIPVTNTPGVVTESTADLTWILLMATARKIPLVHNFTATGQWKGPLGKELMGLDISPGGSNSPKVLGIIGFGNIGQAVMRRSRGFRMKVLAFDPPMREVIEKKRGVEYRELHELLRESDFVTLHCPMTEETRHIIGTAELDLMKPTAILINASRGPVVDEKALVVALKKKKIYGAGLDVFENEPRLSPGLAKLDNVVLVPHIGTATEDTRVQMAIVAVRNAIDMVKGKRPANIVNSSVLESARYLRKAKPQRR